MLLSPLNKRKEKIMADTKTETKIETKEIPSIYQTENPYLASYAMMKLQLKEVTGDTKTRKVTFVFDNPTKKNIEAEYYGKHAESMGFCLDIFNVYTNVLDMLWKEKRRIKNV